MEISGSVAEPLNTYQLYIGFYGRPPDSAGLKYWVNISQDIIYHGITGWEKGYAQMHAAFANSAEAQQYVFNDASGKPLSHSALVGRVYNNLFSRDPDAEGLQFYTNALDTGAMSLVNIVKQIIDGSQNQDTTALHNKVIFSAQVQKAFSTHTDVTYDLQALDQARVLLGHVNSSTESAAQGKIAAEYLLYDTAIRYNADVPKPEAPRPFAAIAAFADAFDTASNVADDAPDGAAVTAFDDQAVTIDFAGVPSTADHIMA